MRSRLMTIYRRLRRSRGAAGWWPARTRFEVCVGAILTQNTAWANVEKALASLRGAGRLSFAALNRLSAPEIAPLIRSSGVFNVKARRLRAFLDFLGSELGGRCHRMASYEAQTLRRRLLAIPGIGRETADSIALYAANQPLFVVDAYTHRLFSRLGITRGDEPYDVLQARIMASLPRDVALFNDYHAQIVLHGKDVCRPRPRCEACVLSDLCAFARSDPAGKSPQVRPSRRRSSPARSARRLA
jgi:endonuclease-3 related protein